MESFTSLSYKISLIKCLKDRSFKIFNNWNYSYNDIENIKSNLTKNGYPSFLINKVNKKNLDYKFSSNQLRKESGVPYFKLLYIGNLSHHIQNELSKICKKFRKEIFNIKLVFISFKTKNSFSYKHPIPDDLKSFLVYKFTCASCSSTYIGKTRRHFIILKLELMNISKRITSLIFVNIYSPPQHPLTQIIFFVLK